MEICISLERSLEYSSAISMHVPIDQGLLLSVRDFTIILITTMKSVSEQT